MEKPRLLTPEFLDELLSGPRAGHPWQRRETVCRAAPGRAGGRATSGPEIR